MAVGAPKRVGSGGAIAPARITIITPGEAALLAGTVWAEMHDLTPVGGWWAVWMPEGFLLSPVRSTGDGIIIIIIISCFYYGLLFLVLCSSGSEYGQSS